MQHLRPAEAAALCALEPAPLLLDVREGWEVALATIRIAGAPAMHIPMGEMADRLGELDPAHPVLCICHHGMRSAQVGAFLAHQGFESVYNLAGGIDAWSQQLDATVPRY